MTEDFAKARKQRAAYCATMSNVCRSAHSTQKGEQTIADALANCAAQRDKTCCAHPGCLTKASYAPLFSHNTHCAVHAAYKNYLGEPLYVLFPHEKSHPHCATAGCAKFATFAPNNSEDNYPVLCEDHADAEEYHQIDYIAQPCVTCAKLALLNALDHNCPACAIGVSRSREAQFAQILNEAGLTPTFANKVSPQLRAVGLRNRPDFIFETDHSVILVEIDEDQHNRALGNIFTLTCADFSNARDYDLRASRITNYSKKQEIARMTQVARAYQDRDRQRRAIVFLRINPDSFRDNREVVYPPLSHTFDDWAPRLVEFIKQSLIKPFTDSFAVAFARFRHQRARQIDIFNIKEDCISRDTFPPLPPTQELPPVIDQAIGPLTPAENIARIIAQLNAEKNGLVYSEQGAPGIQGRTRTKIQADLDCANAAHIIIAAFSRAENEQLKTNSAEYARICEAMWRMLSSKTGIREEYNSNETAMRRVLSQFGYNLARVGEIERPRENGHRNRVSTYKII